MASGYGNNALFLQTMQSLGVPLNTAIGAMGSLGWESGIHLDNTARNAGDGADGSDSIGWGQWNGPRARSLISTGQQMGLDWHDPRVQAAHIKNELTGQYAPVLSALKGVNSVGAGADIWTRRYEVPAIINSADRAKRGVAMAQSMGVPLGGDYTDSINALASTASAGTEGSSGGPSGYARPPAGGALTPEEEAVLGINAPDDNSSLAGMMASATNGSSLGGGGWNQGSGGLLQDPMEVAKEEQQARAFGDDIKSDLSPVFGQAAGSQYAAGASTRDGSDLGQVFKLNPSIGAAKSLKRTRRTV